MVLTKGTSDFGKEASQTIVPYILSIILKYFSSCSLQACVQACSKVNGLQFFVRLSLRILARKCAKDPRKVA